MDTNFLLINTPNGDFIINKHPKRVKRAKFNEDMESLYRNFKLYKRNIFDESASIEEDESYLKRVMMWKSY